MPALNGSTFPFWPLRREESCRQDSEKDFSVLRRLQDAVLFLSVLFHLEGAWGRPGPFCTQ